MVLNIPMNMKRRLCSYIPMQATGEIIRFLTTPNAHKIVKMSFYGLHYRRERNGGWLLRLKNKLPTSSTCEYENAPLAICRLLPCCQCPPWEGTPPPPGGCNPCPGPNSEIPFPPCCLPTHNLGQEEIRFFNKLLFSQIHDDWWALNF